MNIQRASLALLLAAGLVGVSAPAFAKTSITKSQQLCETALTKQQPAPKDTYIENDKTAVSDAVATFTFRVRNADNSAGKVQCAVDRKASTVSLTVLPQAN